MTPAACARIDLAALRHNLAKAREAAPGKNVLAVVKANGYGHGALRVAAALDEADAFAVARLEEALELREGGITRPLLVLEGVAGPEEVELAARRGIDLVVHHRSQIDVLEASRPAEPVRVWLKVDSGMHRLGVPPEEAEAHWRRLGECRAVASPLRLMSHLANADDRRDRSTSRQVECIEALARRLGAQTSLANSAGVLGWPQAHGDWIRPGIMLYGISPFIGGRGEAEGLVPVMTLTSRLIAVNRVAKGEAIGYGGTWVCPEEMPVGVAAIGYGDGYPRHAPSGTPVLVNGARVPLVGRVSMDLVTLDLRTQPDAAPGDPVVLWGRGLPAEEIAQQAGTIAYELVCRVAPRVDTVAHEA